jgi:hypothetical protein
MPNGINLPDDFNTATIEAKPKTTVKSKHLNGINLPDDFNTATIEAKPKTTVKSKPLNRKNLPDDFSAPVQDSAKNTQNTTIPPAVIDRSKQQPDQYTQDNQQLGNILNQSGNKLNEAIGDFSKGPAYIPSALLKLVQGAIDVPASGFGAADWLLKHIPGGEGASQILNIPGEIAGNAFDWGEDLIEKGLNKAGIKEPDWAKNDAIKSATSALHDLSKTGAEILAYDALGKMGDVVKTKMTGEQFKPMVDIKSTPEGHPTDFQEVKPVTKSDATTKIKPGESKLARLKPSELHPDVGFEKVSHTSVKKEVPQTPKDPESHIDVGFEEVKPKSKIPLEESKAAEPKVEYAEDTKKLDLGGNTLNSTIPFVKEFIDHTLKPIFKTAYDTVKGAVDLFINHMAPTARVGRDIMETMLKSKGFKDKVNFKIAAALDKYYKDFQKLSDEESIDFVDRVKRRQKQPNANLQLLADIMRKWDDKLYNMIKVYKPSLSYLENHFRVLWIDEAKQGIKGIGLRPWEGTKGFLHKHILDDMSEGTNNGGVPVTYNPVEMFMLHAQDAMKFISAQKAWTALKASGIAKFIKFGERAPDGFVKIKDNIARVYFPVEEGMVNAGEYYVQDGAARLINNMLSKDYIRENEFGKGIMSLKNWTTGLELGFSPFHAVFESIESIGSSIGLGMAKMFTKGQTLSGLKDLATALISPKMVSALGKSTIEFAKDADEFRSKNPEAYDFFIKNYPDAEQMIDDMFDAGAKLTMHEDYKARAIKGFQNSLKNNDQLGAALKAFPAFSELMLHPLFETFIPRLKLGTYMREYSFELLRNEKELADGTLKRNELARKVWNFTEDRFGELNWDNLYWDRTVKSAFQLVFRSTTWKLGNLRGFGKAGRDLLGELAAPVTQGRAPRITLPMGWLLGTAMTTSLVSSIITKTTTGKYPWELADDAVGIIKNLVYPRIDAKDDTQRLSVPTYFRDPVSMSHSVPGYIKNSMSGEIGRTMELWDNKDFYGDEIIKPNDPLYKQSAEALGHLVPLPFSLQSYMETVKSGEGIGKAALSATGFGKAPSYISRSETQNAIYEAFNRYVAPFAKSPGETETSEVKSNIKRLQKEGKSEEANKLLIESVHNGMISPKSSFLKQFKLNFEGYNQAESMYQRLPADVQKNILEKMDFKEMLEYLRVSNKNALQNSPELVNKLKLMLANMNAKDKIKFQRIIMAKTGQHIDNSEGGQ